MKNKITEIISERTVTEDFAPCWQFSGVVYFNEPLSGENLKQAGEIVAALTKMIKDSE